MCHFGLLQRSPWNMTGWKNWVQRLLNDRMDKLFNSLKVPKWTNQIQTQIMIERSNPLSGATQGPRQVEEKRPVPRRSKHVLFNEEAVKHDKAGTPVVGRDTNHEPGASQTRSSDESKSFNVEDKTAHDRTVTPVVGRDTSHEPGASQTRSSHESTNFNVGDETNHDRTGKSVVGRDKCHEPGNEQSMLNEVNIDFRIPGLPHICCETSSELSCSSIGQEDRELPSPTCSSTRSTTKQRQQPVQYEDKANDSGRGRRSAVWTVRDGP